MSPARVIATKALALVCQCAYFGPFAPLRYVEEPEPTRRGSAPCSQGRDG